MEEIHVRSNMALAQKRFVHDIECGVDEDSDELLKLTAQVVSRLLPTHTLFLNSTQQFLTLLNDLTLPGQGDIEAFCRYD